MFGVYAAGTRQFNVDGRVAFTSKLVDATVSVLKADGATSVEGLTYEEVDEQDEQSILGKADQSLVDFDLGTFTLDDDKVYMGYKVTIQNDDQEAIYVRITAPTGTVGVLTANAPAVTGATLVPETTTDYEIAIEGTLVVTFTFVINPDTASVGADQDLAINSAFQLASTVENLEIV